MRRGSGSTLRRRFPRRHDTILVVKKGGPLIDFPQYEPLRGSYRCLDTSHEVSNLTYRERVEQAVALVQELAPGRAVRQLRCVR